MVSEKTREMARTAMTKTQNTSNKTHANPHFKGYSVAKKQCFSASMASAQCRTVELFQVVRGFLGSGLQDQVDSSVAYCDRLTKNLKIKSHVSSRQQT